MPFLMTFLVFSGCVLAMAVGLIFAKKVLKKSCSTDPDACACLKEGKDPSRCDK